MFRFRRVVVAALEDFGVRRRPQVAAAQVATETLMPTSPPVLPAGIVWQDTARRRPELQRFCDHLDSLRESVP